jgi:hypothetical protein
MSTYLNLDPVASIPGLIRSESISNNEMGGLLSQRTHAVYPHDELYGEFCTVHAYIDCPPDKVFAYMSDLHSLEEWSYGIRNLVPSHIDGVFVGRDMIDSKTDIFCKVECNASALTVDYHCAWDQGDELWMIYLNRIVPAETVLKKPGSVVFWQNCHHPYYSNNPHQDSARKGRLWVGDLWDIFYAGHAIELDNLKAILEYRHRNDLPIGPYYK